MKKLLFGSQQTPKSLNYNSKNGESCKGNSKGVVDFKVGGWHRLLDLSKAKISGFLNSSYLAAHFSAKANYFFENTLSQPHITGAINGESTDV